MAVLVGLAVALLVGSLLAGRIVRRIAAPAAHGAARRAPGPGRGHDRRRAARDEVGDLTRAFATMQDRLREQEEARRALRRHGVARAAHAAGVAEADARAAAARTWTPAAPRRGRARAGPARAQASAAARALADELLDLSRLDAGVPLRRELSSSASCAAPSRPSSRRARASAT